MSAAKRTTHLHRLSQSALLLICLAAAAQTSPPPRPPAFEVASVRLSPPDHGFFTISPSGALEFRANTVSMLFLLDLAFGFNPNQTVGAPGWAESTLYDVSAKPEGNVGLTYEQLKPALQNLLKERFHLQAHIERRERNGYALVVAKGGSKLQKAGDTVAPTGSIFSEGLRSPSLPMSALAGMLAIPVGSPVVDQTGLTGNYVVNLKYASLNSSPDDTAADPGLPSVFTAVTEQLGLRLNRQKISLDFLIVDHVDQLPTAN